MARVLRIDGAHPGDDRRWLVGVTFSSRLREVSVALVGVRGRGLDARIEISGQLARPVPREAANAFQQLGGQGSPPSLEILVELRAALAISAAEAVGTLLDGCGCSVSRALAIGVSDPGWWRHSRSAATAYEGLCDPARLAALSGLCVIDAFPAGDLARGGQGGPLGPLGQWLILRDTKRDRVLLDLGRTTRISLLPAYAAPDAVDRIQSFEVGPGTSLLDQLTHRLSGGQQSFDPGGRLGVQGRKIAELLDHWLHDPYFERATPRWHPHGVRPERFLADAFDLAMQHGWAVADLLCTATHLVAHSVAQTIARRLPSEAQKAELIVAGGGQHNGLLLRELASQSGLTPIRLAELLAQPEALEPACAAVLALGWLDQTPTSLPACTGSAAPSVLGRLTPGTSANWQRVLQAIATSLADKRALRAAG